MVGERGPWLRIPWLCTVVVYLGRVRGCVMWTQFLGSRCSAPGRGVGLGGDWVELVAAVAAAKAGGRKERGWGWGVWLVGLVGR